MIFSMTGYATHTAAVGRALVTIDLRSVNQRYLEIGFRLPDELRAQEPAIREAIVQRLSRGKIECRISQTPLPEAAQDIGLNDAILESLARWQGEVRKRFPDAAPLAVAEILRWNGALALPEGETTDVALELLAAVGAALDDLAASRQREGEKLQKHIVERLDRAETLIAEAAGLLPGILSAYQEKLAARLKEALGEPANERLAQEFALFAQKIDVDEELSRFSTHIKEVRRILDKGGAVGKRLDFLMQELNREANTLGSKSVSPETTRISVELKVLIEQMREQIQNIE
jgi:TIGR00255 family protein